MRLDFLEAGEIVTTHGVRGEVKVLPWSDGPEFLLDFKRVRIEGAEYKIESCRIQKNCNLIKLQGVETMEQAQALHGKILEIYRADTPKDVIFAAELIGMEVYEGENSLGKITDGDSVVFYNFGEVGQNENERIVGGFDFYDNQLIGEVEFLNENTVVVVSENILSFYTIKEYPKLIKNVEIEYDIEQIFYSEKNIAYIYTNDNHKKVICVYNTEGDEVFGSEISDIYSAFEFTDKGIVMYGKDKFRIITEKGKEKYEGNFETEISQIVPLNSNEDYLFITIEKLHKVKMK